MSLTFHPSIAERSLPLGLRLDTIVAVVATVFVSALWAICHPYSGIVGDSTVYMGRVLADIDPTGVGRDLMFVNDGQSKFSLFPILARPLVAATGASTAALIIAMLGSACWLAALFAIAFSLTSGRLAWAIVIVVSVMPVGYGGNAIFSFAETAALPRPFAEAAVIAALAALLRERIGVALGLLLLAMALHPLMALPGVGVMAVVMLWRMTAAGRVIALLIGAAGLAGVVVLGWLGFDLFDRFVMRVDPEWMGMLLQRSPHLFPTLWMADGFAPIIAQVATIVLAARFLPESPRRVFLSVLVVAVGGLVLSVALADLAHLLLFVQVQAWRVTWLLAVVGSCALAYCAPFLWQRGNVGRLILACLIFVWFDQAGPFVDLAILAVALTLDLKLVGLEPNDRVVLLFYMIVGTLVGIGLVVRLIAYLDYLQIYPRALPHLVDPIRNNLHTVPVLLLTVFFLGKVKRVGPKALMAMGAGAVLLILATVALWDQRSWGGAYFEVSHVVPGVSDLHGGSQEVLWLDARGEPWFTLGRPQYLSPQQAVSIVFSRSLAMEWHRRADRLIELGLAQRRIYSPSDPIDDDDHLHVSQRGIDLLCRDPGAPRTIIIPLNDNVPAPALRGMVTWTLPREHYAFDRFRSGVRWHAIRHLAIVTCPPRGA